MQKKIIDDNSSKYIAVLAGPGSGKTRVLVHKLASLLLLEDVKSEQLLMLTFSRAATCEFRQRLVNLIGNAAYYVGIKTFHSFAFDLLGKIGNEKEFDEIVPLATEMIRNNEIEQSKITKTVLVIDEAQDIDKNEYDLLCALVEANPDMRVIAVGDDDQNIYAFRGSSSKYMVDLVMNQDGSKEYELLENYRSTKKIIDYSNAFAKSIKTRLKKNEVTFVRKDLGIVSETKYNCDYLINPVADLVKRLYDPSKKVAVLSKTNEEAYAMHLALRKRGIDSKLIQSSDLKLYKLIEFIKFKELVNVDDNPIISDELWDDACTKLKEVYVNSSTIEIINNALSMFEKTYLKKYKSDLEDFLLETELDEVCDSKNSNVIISTIHKAKGHEFDSVYLSLAGSNRLDDDEKRKVYVGLTRAKTNLYLSSNTNYFDKYSKYATEIKTDSKIYDEPKELLLDLTLGDVVLGCFISPRKRSIIKDYIPGSPLEYNELDGYYYYEGEKMAKLSSSFKEKFNSLINKNYSIKEIKIEHIVSWRDKNDLDSKEEWLVVLPSIHLIKKDLNDSDNKNSKEVDVKTNEAKPYDKMDLLSELKKIRLQIAKEKNVPAFYILSDKSLIDMAEKKPRTIEELLKVDGVGQIKSNEYGEKFLKRINDYITIISEIRH